MKGVQERLSVMDFDVVALGHKAFGPYVREQIDSWGRLAREVGVRAELSQARPPYLQPLKTASLDSHFKGKSI